MKSFVGFIYLSLAVAVSADWTGVYTATLTIAANHETVPMVITLVDDGEGSVYGQYDDAGFIVASVDGGNVLNGLYFEAGGYNGNFQLTTPDGGNTFSGSIAFDIFGYNPFASVTATWVSEATWDTAWWNNAGSVQGSWLDGEYLTEIGLYDGFVNYFYDSPTDFGVLTGQTLDGSQYFGRFEGYSNGSYTGFAVGYVDGEGVLQESWFIAPTDVLSYGITYDAMSPISSNFDPVAIVTGSESFIAAENCETPTCPSQSESSCDTEPVGTQINFNFGGMIPGDI